MKCGQIKNVTSAIVGQIAKVHFYFWLHFIASRYSIKMTFFSVMNVEDSFGSHISLKTTVEFILEKHPMNAKSVTKNSNFWQAEIVISVFNLKCSN